MYDLMIYLIYQIRLPIIIGEPAHKIIHSLTTIILSILFPLSQLATIEIPSNSPPKFINATGEWATAKRTPCCMYFLAAFVLVCVDVMVMSSA